MFPPIDLPEEWQRIDLTGLRGVVMVVGGIDTGKSTFARYLFTRLNTEVYACQPVACLDGDTGQTALGPPATMTVAFGVPGSAEYPPGGNLLRFFTGSTTPVGHMLPTVIAAQRLAAAALDWKPEPACAIIYDTCGMIDPLRGGLALHLAEADLLRPGWIFALQRQDELEPLLRPLRRSGRAEVITLQPVPAAGRRSTAERQRHRRIQFRAHFERARTILLKWDRLAVFPAPTFRLNRLAAIEDSGGFTLALGIIVAINRERREIALLTPLETLEGASALRLGDMLVDPGTFEDTLIR